MLYILTFNLNQFFILFSGLINMNTLTCLWIKGELPSLQKECLRSWLRLGYNVNLHTYYPKSIKFFDNNLTIIKEDLKDREMNENGNLPESDYWRFKYLYENGGTWIDFDMYLLKRLPETDMIISSEHAKQVGAFKRYVDRTPNIGVMRFPKGDDLLQRVMKKIEVLNKDGIACNSFMKIFQKYVEREEPYKNIIADPNDYCPISWAYARDIYRMKELTGSKFGIKQKGLDEIFQKSYSIHLWNNIKRTKKYEPIEGSIYNQIINNNSSFSFKIAIPSYNRAEQLKSKTLSLLDKYNIDKSLITIYINDDKQFENYQEVLDNEYKLHITNEKGIGNNRQYIRRNYPDNTNLIFLDDDIEKIFDKGSQTKEVLDLYQFFQEGFKLCYNNEATLWGIPLIDNLYFMKDNVSTNLKYIGAVYGVILTNEVKKIEVCVDQWEDYVYSIEHFKLDKKVVRLNNYGIKSNWYNKNGGICSAMGGKEHRLAMLDASADELCQQYSGFIKKYYKKDGLVNLRLNYRAIVP